MVTEVRDKIVAVMKIKVKVELKTSYVKIVYNRLNLFLYEICLNFS